MSIPTMTKDLAVIQKLSDLPNSTEGLTADQLKAKFDEAALALQSWLNETLVPAIVAANIPFTPSSTLDASNVDAAIRAVQEQMTEVSSGAIANGSVTAEKLSETLLERVYGGRVWVGLDTPGSDRNVAAGYPIGQIWLRPEFTVNNTAGTGWTVSGCTISQDTDRFTVTGNNTVTTASISQVLSGLGQDGDRVYVLFSVENADSELTALAVSLNGGAERDASGGVFAGTLSGGNLTVRLSATWPSTSLAGGSYDIVNYTVVNVDAILRQTQSAEDMTDWAGYLTALLPLTVYTSPAEVFIQTGDGSWWPMGYTTLPVSRGGTGMDSVGSGELLYGDGTGLTKLPATGDNGSFLQLVDGMPRWQSVDEAASGGSILRVMTGSYKGTGSSQTVNLPVEPKLLNISSPSGGATDNGLTAPLLRDRPTTLGQGGKDTASYTASVSGGTTARSSSVALSGSTVTVDGPYFCNRSGVTYNWVAIY